MSLRPPALCLLALLWSVVPALAQAPAASSAARDVDVDLMTSRVAFQADGRREAAYTVRLRVHTAAGVEQAGTVTIPFRQGAGTLTVDHVRVRKPDGREVETPTTAFFDQPSPVTQSAPIYSDVYFRHINVQALQPGDTLEYAWAVTEASLVPGYFEMTEVMAGEAFEGRRLIEVSWPSDVHPTVKSGSYIPEIATAAGRTTYRWDVTVEATSLDDDRDNLVRISSFTDWSEVGRVVRDLWRDRADVTPAIRAKALELTADLPSNDAKARALYRYVSTSIRYVAVAIGVGRIQPNPAETVLSNGFGDCKDKHVLLEALLRAVGIEATPVLIDPDGDVDRDLPSFGQFSHVITLIAQGLGAPVWLDATIAVAPFDFLVAGERDVAGLTLPASGTPTLTTTPADARVASVWRTETTGRIDEDGRLQATVTEEVTGDIEVFLRFAFRSAGRQQWESLVRALPLGKRQGATIADLVVTPPDETATPFRLAYRYTVDGFVDWSRGTLLPPLPMEIPEIPPDDADDPIDTGGIGSTVMVTRLELPERIEILDGADADVDLARPFGRYRFRWSMNGRAFEAERELSSTLGEIPVDQLADYRTFIADVRGTSASVRVRRLNPWAWSDALTIDWYERASPSTTRGLGEAAATARQGDYQQAMATVQRVLDDEPESDAAWQMLAWMQMSSGASARALDTLQRRAPRATGPSLLKYYASRLLAAGRREQAAAVLRSGADRFPADGEIALYLAETLVAIQRGAEAVPLLAPLADRQRDSARYHLALARAQFAARDRAAAVAAFLRSAELDDGAGHLNLVAWELTERGLALDDAVRLAERAIRTTSAQVADLTVETVDASGLRTVASLPRQWDTLGRAHHKRGDLATALRYLEAAWQVSQDPVIARHLLAVHAQSGNREASARYADYADARDGAAAARYANRPELAWRVEAMTTARDVLTRAWTIDLAGDLDVTTPIDALLLVDRDGRVRDVRLFGPTVGSDSAVREALRAIAVPWTPPDERATQMLRRGTVRCAQGACVLQVRSTNEAAVGLPE